MWVNLYTIEMLNLISDINVCVIKSMIMSFEPHPPTFRVPQGFDFDVLRQSHGPLIIKEPVCFRLLKPFSLVIEILVESILDRS